MSEIHFCDDCETLPCMCDEYGAEDDDGPIECELCDQDVDECTCFEECDECENIEIECICSTEPGYLQ